jgi:hypothetical protein
MQWGATFEYGNSWSALDNTRYLRSICRYIYAGTCREWIESKVNAGDERDQHNCQKNPNAAIIQLRFMRKHFDLLILLK